MLKSLLQGKPFRHPIHPALVHFPIGLFILSLILDVLSLLMEDSMLVHSAYYTIAGGIVMGFLLYSLGWLIMLIFALTIQQNELPHDICS